MIPNRFIEPFERYLSELFGPDRSGMHESMNYTLLAPGKRFRPILVFEAYEDVLGPLESLPQPVFELAGALEAIHNYSLIHDDLPCMDDDDFRRGRPTAHKVFGEAVALLAGDGLLSAAAEILAEGLGSLIESGDIEAARRYSDAQRRILRASGPSGMIEGQRLDTSNHGKLPLDDVERINRLKTGELIAASVYAGARFAGASAELAARFEQLGWSIGSIFQITDDILDVEGDPALVGKTLAKDQKRDMATYVSILGVRGARARVDEIAASSAQLASEIGAERVYRRMQEIVTRRK